MLMEMYMMENGRMIKRTDMAFTITQTVQNMKDNGTKTSSTERVLRFGPTMLNTKASIRKARSMDMVNSSGLTTPHTTVCFTTTIFTVLVFTNGQMAVNTMENGKITRCMVPESLLGTMVVDMKVSM